MKNLMNVALRQQAVFIPKMEIKNDLTALRGTTSVLVANLAKLGFGVSESLLRALNNASPKFQGDLLDKFREVTGVNKNWTPLVKGWDTPTGEGILDHIFTFLATAFKGKGTELACGHIVPADTFPLHRYNGCPFCGTPFEVGKIEKLGQGSKLKVLELWSETEINDFFVDLLSSKTALDATQMDSLKILLTNLPLPTAPTVAMKETLMAVIDILVETDGEKAQALFTSPTDILRYLWYKKTGFLQIIEPKIIAKRAKINAKRVTFFGTNTEETAKAKLEATKNLKLKYDRKTCSMVAKWLNNLPIENEKMAETMHPKRGMWVRFIRALRLTEYSKKVGFEKLKGLLDIFYKEDYDVWQGRVNYYRLKADAETTFKFLKQRPGLFARSLFSNMLWFGAEETTAAFAEIIDKVPARLVFTLNMYANNYFSHNNRTVKPLGGTSKSIPANSLISLYNEVQLEGMKEEVENLCLLAMEKRFSAIKNENKTIFIAPDLFKMPVAIGDRSESVQDLPSALMGTRFAVEGDAVRLFMQWGNDLPAQHLDMDLSCHIAYSNNKTEFCSFAQLTATGCKHSGDIQYIPNKVGTAEYIEIDVPKLQKAGAKYVTFTCNAYSNGAISPNLVIGWMNSKNPMTISSKSGVAYDPSCVQHKVRVTTNAAKGLVFGVLDVEKAEIVWLELPFSGQLVGNLDTKNIENMLSKLNAKLSVGQLLAIKAKAQNLEIVDTDVADEVYDRKWASNSASVTQLLID